MNLSKERKRLLAAFTRRFGPGGAVYAALAPGRSNLIGEHTDYNGGLVLPIAVDRHTAVLFRAGPRSGARRVRVYTETLDAADEFDAADIQPAKGARQHWANYVRGTAWALAKRGIRIPGGDLYISSDLPHGAGLSSSASLEVAAGLAFLALAQRRMHRQELAFACQAAEHAFAGVKCGIMDQTVVARARAGHALLLDCASMQIRHVPIALNNYRFAVFDTGVRHKLASSEYNKRRAECEHAAKRLKRPSLRQASLEDLLKHGARLTAGEHKRVRHVLSENMRVAHFAAALSRGDLRELGELLDASHHSLAMDYEVSCRELDALVAELNLKNIDDGACPGARMTGGGFGGAVVALLKTRAFESYHKAMRPFAKGGALLLAPSAGASVAAL